MTRLFLAVLITLFSCDTFARVRAVASRIDSARRILVVIAHPDDELLIAPLLGNRCVTGGASCSFLVMTNGDHPARAGEMARAAALFNARLTIWSYPDVMSDVGATWSNGDRPALVQQLANSIALEQSDMIVTFDPAHGSTGHPAHRELGQLVLETGARNVWLIETAARFIGGGFELSNAAPERASVIIANEAWQFVVRDAETHASQFTPEQIESLRTLPAEQRKVWLMRAP